MLRLPVNSPLSRASGLSPPELWQQRPLLFMKTNLSRLFNVLTFLAICAASASAAPIITATKDDQFAP